MQITPDTPQILLVASPNDIQASELIIALRAAKVNLLIADTITLASRADEFAVCIIILRPGQWRTTSTITTAMRCNPRYLVPVLAEPMSLPAGAWATDAINIKEPLSETVDELKVLINRRLQIAAEDTHKDQKPHTKNDFGQQEFSTFRTISYNRTGRRLGSIGKYALIGLILVLIAGIVVYYGLLGKHLGSGHNTNTQIGGSNVVASAFKQGYTVNVPGPGCNVSGKDWWGVGTHFKILGTPTATTVNKGTTPKRHEHLILSSTVQL